MITVEVNGKRYTITDCRIVSEGEAKEYIEDCIWVETHPFPRPSEGFLERVLYGRLSRYKSIKVISCDFKPPKDAEQTIY